MAFRVILVFLFLHLEVEAAGGDSIPFQFVFFQILNFSLFALVLAYFVRKKGPFFLQRKREDFLEYQKKAKKMEEQSRLDCLSLKKEVEALVEKEKNIKKSVENALNSLKKAGAEQEKQWMENVRKQANQNFMRQELKGRIHLKNRVLSKIIQQTRTQLTGMKKPDLSESLNRQMIQKWERM